jgi:hypothetical protein
VRKNKLKVEVFFPFGSCACAYAPLMEKVARVTSKFKDYVEVQMKSSSSKEAHEYSVQDSCVIVDETVRLSADFDEKQLEEAILQRNSKER